MRYSVTRHEDGSWLVIDSKGGWPKTIATCKGNDAPFNAERICQALEAHIREIETWAMGNAMEDLKKQ
jgi:hypothetical protein